MPKKSQDYSSTLQVHIAQNKIWMKALTNYLALAKLPVEAYSHYANETLFEFIMKCLSEYTVNTCLGRQTTAVSADLA